MHLIPVGGNGTILLQRHRGSQLWVEGNVSVTDPGWHKSVTEQCAGCHKAPLIIPRVLAELSARLSLQHCVQEEKH